MTQKEIKILEAIEKPNANEHGYRYVSFLKRDICIVMGYKGIENLNNGFFQVWHKEDDEKCDLILKGMEKAGYIKISKSGKMYKVL